MTRPGVRCHGVSKRFRRGEHHDSLRDLLTAAARSVMGRRQPRDPSHEFWAVRDISFEVQPGQALGIIGPNGAGKSTLLKLLTRVMRPTTGVIDVQGRFGALIEIAAGFHPDLTGRENVGLQGSIMGMKRIDIDRKFDQIVEFSGIGEFIDTPVKRYSSGMNARLGFAIAAHLDPDVLFIDEVLSVGDVGFQQKAFGRVQDLVRSGIPVVVVSHQLERVAQLCTDAILLDHGKAVCQGTPAECIEAYLNPRREVESVDSNAPVVLERLAIESSGEILSGGHVSMRIEGRVASGGVPELVDPVVLVVRNSASGAIVSATGSLGSEVALDEGGFALDVTLQMNVPRGLYVIQAFVWNRKTDRSIGKGPSAVISVDDGVPFAGPVQLNAKMSVAAAVG